MAERAWVFTFIGVERNLGFRLAALDCCNGIEHIGNTVAIGTHRRRAYSGVASCSTRSRKRGRSPRSLTTSTSTPSKISKSFRNPP
ncbi:hypothetical protein Thimo_2724 [Thioflavicoccus mobilis 8321]|uniref:Uncharacterized protein n=1 Tax=Thioflavicoccus mobilis 8321 TaxID=765912 RepID=L0H1H1_9GAMM|nr:hypothetical protein Thimo_2724 [Thioflavicoccus mobilis 8321]